MATYWNIELYVILLHAFTPEFVNHNYINVFILNTYYVHKEKIYKKKKKNE